MLTDGFVKVTTQRVGRGKIPALGTHSHEAVGVDDVNFAGCDGQGRVKDMFGIIGWVIVDNAQPSVLQPTFEKAGCFLPLGLDVGDVGYS